MHEKIEILKLEKKIRFFDIRGSGMGRGTGNLTNKDLFIFCYNLRKMWENTCESFSGRKMKLNHDEHEGDCLLKRGKKLEYTRNWHQVKFEKKLE